MTLNGVLNDGQAADRALDDFDRSPSAAVLMYGVNPAKPGYASPLNTGQFGGGAGGGGAAAPEVTQTYPPQVLGVSGQEVSLTVPAGANRALVTVTIGAARLGLGDAATAPSYAVNEGLLLAGAQLAALRLIRDGNTDATARIDYWREA